MNEKVLLSILLYLGIFLAPTGRKGGRVGHCSWADSMKRFLIQDLVESRQVP